MGKNYHDNPPVRKDIKTWGSITLLKATDRGSRVCSATLGVWMASTRRLSRNRVLGVCRWGAEHETRALSIVPRRSDETQFNLLGCVRRRCRRLIDGKDQSASKLLKIRLGLFIGESRNRIKRRTLLSGHLNHQLRCATIRLVLRKTSLESPCEDRKSKK